MNSYETLDVRVDARGVASLTLDLPEKRNALTVTMIAELTHFATVAARKGGLRAVVLSGTGGTFCAGGDLAWMRAQIDGDRATRLSQARTLARMLKALNDLPLPLIGKVQGAAFGGGVGLVSVCDIAFAQTETRFGLTETRLGLIPATIGPYVLKRLGESKARRVFMSGRVFDAREAANLGLIADALAADALDERIEREVAAYLRAAPGAVAAAKAFAQTLGGGITDAQIDRSIEQLAHIWETPEAREGIEAFFAKTQPTWVPKDLIHKPKPTTEM